MQNRSVNEYYLEFIVLVNKVHIEPTWLFYQWVKAWYKTRCSISMSNNIIQSREIYHFLCTFVYIQPQQNSPVFFKPIHTTLHNT